MHFYLLVHVPQAACMQHFRTQPLSALAPALRSGAGAGALPAAVAALPPQLRLHAKHTLKAKKCALNPSDHQSLDQERIYPSGASILLTGSQKDSLGQGICVSVLDTWT